MSTFPHLALPNPGGPQRPDWPGWHGVRGLRPGPALAGLIASVSPDWPGWIGGRPGVDHTKHAGHRDREANR